MNIIFTKANSDTDGRIINQMLEDYVSNHKEKSCIFASLGQLRYLSAISTADVVVGNSSSGLSEVPSFHVPTVNVGDRQKGRESGKTVIHCDTNTKSIVDAISKALSDQFRDEISHAANPYEKEGTSDTIVDRITKFIKQDNIDLKKKFFNL